MSLFDNLLSSSLFSESAPTETSLESLVGGFAPQVAGAPAMNYAPVPQPTQFMLSRGSASSYKPRPRNPLAGLNRGLTPEFVGMLTKRRQLKESSIYPNFYKGGAA